MIYAPGFMPNMPRRCLPYPARGAFAGFSHQTVYLLLRNLGRIRKVSLAVYRREFPDFFKLDYT